MSQEINTEQEEERIRLQIIKEAQLCGSIKIIDLVGIMASDELYKGFLPELKNEFLSGSKLRPRKFNPSWIPPEDWEPPDDDDWEPPEEYEEAWNLIPEEYSLSHFDGRQFYWMNLIKRWTGDNPDGVKKKLPDISYIQSYHWDRITGAPQSEPVNLQEAKPDYFNDYLRLLELKSYFEWIQELLPNFHLPDWLLEAGSQEKEIKAYVKKEVPDDVKRNSFSLTGDYWIVRYDGEEKHLKNRERLRYVVHLLDNPTMPFYPSDLISLVKGQRVDANKDYENMTKEQLEEEGLVHDELPIETLSDEEKKFFMDKIHILWDDLVRAKKNDDGTSIKEAQGKYDALSSHLYNEYGVKVIFISRGPLFEQKARLTRDAENDRVNVRKHIKNAISDIKKNLPKLADHLNRSIKTGITCRYSPDSSSPIEWHIDWGP